MVSSMDTLIYYHTGPGVPVKDTLSVACDSEEKAAWRALAARLGYPGDDFSEFVRTILNAAVSRYDREGWESRLLYLSGDRVVLTASDLPDVVAFPVVGPGHFWRHLERTVGEAEEEPLPAGD
jgi:hypothetical protein